MKQLVKSQTALFFLRNPAHEARLGKLAREEKNIEKLALERERDRKGYEKDARDYDEKIVRKRDLLPDSPLNLEMPQRANKNIHGKLYSPLANEN